MAHGQTYQDSTGHVPAIRVQESFVAPEGSYWQRLPNQHLFDFSGENGSVYVDPVVQVHGGGTKNMEAEVVWDNIRGARIQATIDGIWHLGGELLERQGVADPMLGYWAVQNRIPGWGRSKLGRQGAWNTLETAYYDVSRARGWCGWSDGQWSVDGGIDALHIGAGNRSAFASIDAAPSPYLRIGFEHGALKSECWATQWNSTERGPLGETAESLFNRSRVFYAVQSWNFHSNWIVQGVYSYVRDKEASIAEEGWQAFGLEESNPYHAERHWGGLELQHHMRFSERSKGILYGQISTDFGGPRWSAGVSSSRGRRLTSLAGWRFATKKWSARLEWVQRTRNHQAEVEFQESPKLAAFEHAGVSVHSLWENALTLQSRYHPIPKLELAATGEINDQFTWGRLAIGWQFQSVWPMQCFASMSRINGSSSTSDPVIYSWQIGIQSAIRP